jgi:hypothetical protein
VSKINSNMCTCFDNSIHQKRLESILTICCKALLCNIWYEQFNASMIVFLKYKQWSYWRRKSRSWIIRVWIIVDEQLSSSYFDIATIYSVWISHLFNKYFTITNIGLIGFIYISSNVFHLDLQRKANIVEHRFVNSI